MKSFNSFPMFLLLLLQFGCSPTGNPNISQESQVKPVDINLFSNPTEIKKYIDKRIRLSAEFDKIDFDLHLPDELRAYRLTHFFVRLVNHESDEPFVMVPTSNTGINGLEPQAAIMLEGTIKTIDDSICLFVTDIKKNVFTGKRR